MDIKQLRDELGLKAKDVAALFDISYMSFANSTARARYERGLVRFYEIVKKQQQLKNGNDGTN